jgi:hypothetical protein
MRSAKQARGIGGAGKVHLSARDILQIEHGLTRQVA